MNRVVGVLISVIALTVYTSRAHCGEMPHYNLGIFPYLPIEQLEKNWSPLVDDLAHAVNWRIHFRSRAGYTQFRDDVANGAFDIVYLQPFAFVRAGADNGYIPLVRSVASNDSKNTGMLNATIVVSQDSPYGGLSDLNGKVIAMPPREAAVSLLARAYFQDAGLKESDDYQVSYHLNHLSCLRQLVVRKAQACVTAHPPYEQFTRTSAVKLRVLEQTNKIPSSLIAVHKTVPPAHRKMVQEYFLNLQDSEAGRRYLHNTGLRGFVLTTDVDYDVVREIWNKMKAK